MSDRLLSFIRGVTHLVQSGETREERVLEQATALMRNLVSVDDWLPAAMAQSDPKYYQQHLLYGDPLDRFSVVSFVWGPGQQTPIHDHTVWGVIGMLRGTECAQSYELDPTSLVCESGPEKLLMTGDVECVSPRIGDIHLVRNAHADRDSVSIHLYGGNIGRIQRHVFVTGSPEPKPFVSGYSNMLSPNLWAKESA